MLVMFFIVGLDVYFITAQFTNDAKQLFNWDGCVAAFFSPSLQPCKRPSRPDPSR